MVNKLSLKIALFILLLIFSSKVLYSQDESSEPKLISQPQLEFPNQAVMGRVMGKVWIDILVNKDGKPVKTKIKRRDPEMAYLFDNKARKWGMGCRFTPAKDDYGNPVQSWITIPLSFVLRDYTPPECRKQAKPEYPEEALEMGMEGWVGLAVLVKSNGDVDYSNIIVVAREPENTSIFEDAAKQAAYHSQYVPAALHSTTVDGWCFIKITFNIIPKN